MKSNECDKKNERKQSLNKMRILLVVAIAILFVLQMFKRNDQKKKISKKEKALIEAKNDHAKILFELPVYRDSIFNIYLTKANGETKLIFLANNITDVQKESTFFVHIYPKNEDLLKDGAKLLGYDFKNKVETFIYNGKEYHYFQRTMPNIELKKLNIGQYGFRGDKQVSWKISELLTHLKISKTLRDNDIEIELFTMKDHQF